MTTWKRWQDYTTMVLGVLLFISPLVFGETSHHLSTYAAYALGVLLFASVIVAAAIVLTVSVLAKPGTPSSRM